ncbi:MAG TPA: CarD family transcriptional regulator [Lachnospiraceae bacterium]|jgi:Transcriptional regulators, similar to M. xanthus CarD|nr:CarD family transcriptional regulator [Lachnospiraceae bacterium]
MFEVGDKIVYPMYGAGVIDDIEVSDKEGTTENHYVIRIPNGNLKIKVAAKKSEQIGIRLVSNLEQLNNAIEQVVNTPVVIQNNWNVRYKENLEKIRSGRLPDVVEVARNLMLRERERSLSGAEKKMLNNAKQIIISEIAYAKEIEQNAAEDYLAKNLLT